MQRQQNSTVYGIEVDMVLSAGGAGTGKTLTIQKSKNGGALSAWGGSQVEIGSTGRYHLTPAAADVNTLGTLAVYCTATGCNPAWVSLDVVAFDPFTQINVVNIIEAASGFDLETGTIELRHNDDYSGLAGGSIVISGINNYDLTDPNISKVFLSMKADDDEGSDVDPVIGPIQASALVAHAATFSLTHAQTALVFSGVGLVFDVLLLYTDGTRRVAVYGPVVIADSVTPLGTT